MDLKQSIRLKNTLLAALGGGVLTVGVLYAFFQQGFAYSLFFLVVFLVVFWLVNIAIIFSIYKGFNLRFKDPSMSGAQMHWASLASIFALTVTNGVDGLFYLLALMPMVFGVFRMPVKAYNRYTFRIIATLFIGVVIRDFYIFPKTNLLSDCVIAFGFSFCALVLSSLCRSVVRMQDRLREKNLQLEKALVARSNFLANMSHEIRTPMNGVLGMIDLSLQHSLQSQTRYNLIIAKESGKALLTIINDILDFSKIDAGKLEIVPKVFSLYGFVEKLILPFKAAARGKGVELTLKLHDNLPKCVYADCSRIQQVLNNLIGNAIKFTHTGYVRVSVKLGGDAVTNASSIDLDFLIEDSGIGIEQDRLNELFESFAQADVSTTREFGGTGLGLAIASELVHLMGGRILVSSELGVGSTFNCSIPAALASECDLELNHKDDPEFLATPGKRLRALLVEDNIINQEVAAMTLDLVGVDTEVASNGEEGLKALAESIKSENVFDMVLMDCQMPVMDGYEATRQIRNNPAFASCSAIPIIALTAHAMAGDRDLCLQAGMNDFLNKPIECSAVASTVERWVGREKYQLQSSTTLQTVVDTKDQAHVDKPETGLQCWNEHALFKLVGERVDRITKLLLNFEKSLDPQVDSVLSAIEKGDVDVLKVQAHGLKGASANLKFERMANACQMLEDLARDDSSEVSEENVQEFLAEVSQVKQILQKQLNTAANNGLGLK